MRTRRSRRRRSLLKCRRRRRRRLHAARNFVGDGMRNFCGRCLVVRDGLLPRTARSPPRGACLRVDRCARDAARPDCRGDDGRADRAALTRLALRRTGLGCTRHARFGGFDRRQDCVVGRVWARLTRGSRGSRGGRGSRCGCPSRGSRAWRGARAAARAPARAAVARLALRLPFARWPSRALRAATAARRRAVAVPRAAAPAWTLFAAAATVAGFAAPRVAALAPILTALAIPVAATVLAALPRPSRRSAARLRGVLQRGRRARGSQAPNGTTPSTRANQPPRRRGRQEPGAGPGRGAATGIGAGCAGVMPLTTASCRGSFASSFICLARSGSSGCATSSNDAGNGSPWLRSSWRRR